MDTIIPNLLDEVPRLLSSGIAEVFDTMLALETNPEPACDLHAGKETILAGSVGFIGDANGVVYLKVTAAFARTLASRMLGIVEAELGDDDMVNDVMGELTNMIVGSVKSRLCDSGTPCVLTIPSIVRGESFRVERACASKRRLLGFRCGNEHIVVELQMKS